MFWWSALLAAENITQASAAQMVAAFDELSRCVMTSLHCGEHHGCGSAGAVYRLHDDKMQTKFSSTLGFITFGGLPSASPAGWAKPSRHLGPPRNHTRGSLPHLGRGET